MAKKKKAKEKRKLSAVPRDLTEAALFLSEVGEKEREIAAITDALNEDIALKTEDAMTQAAPYCERRNELLAGLWAFATNHRRDLLEGEKKSVDLPTGTIGWRTTPPAVGIRNAKKVLAELERLGLDRFIRRDPEPNKQAMLREPEVAEGVKGVRITQKEFFFAKPTMLSAAVEREIKELKDEWET